MFPNIPDHICKCEICCHPQLRRVIPHLLFKNFVVMTTMNRSRHSKVSFPKIYIT